MDKTQLLSTTALPLRVAEATYEQRKAAHMAAGFELGFLKVVRDEAWMKSARRDRSVVVYTTPEDVLNQAQLR